MVNHPDVYENYIEEVTKLEIGSIPVPDMEDVWLNIEKSISFKQQKKASYKYRRIAIGIAAVLLLGLGLGSTGEGYLHYERAYRFISDVLEKSVVMQVNHRKEAEKLEVGITVTEEPKIYTLTFKEATERADFPIKAPIKIPEGFQLKEVQLVELNDKTASVELLYSDKENNLITIKQEPLEGELIEVVKKFTKDASIEEKKKDRYTYFIIEFINGITNVYWDMEDTRFLAKGKEKDLLIDMAFSIK